MLLYITNNTPAALEIADPSPAGGGFVIYIPPSVQGVFVDVTPDQYQRLLPGLLDLEQRAVPPGPGVTGSTCIWWDLIADPFAPPYRDSRAEGIQFPQIDLRSISKLTYSLSAGSNVFTFQGHRFLSKAAVAGLTVGTGAGSIHYSAVTIGGYGNTVKVQHVKPGPNTALSVALSADYTTVIVTLGTNSSGVVTSTAAQVVNAVNTDATAQYFAFATVVQAGTAQPAPATFMSGGVGPAGWDFTFAGYGGGTVSPPTDTTMIFDMSGLISGVPVGTVYPFYLLLGNSKYMRFDITIVA